MYKIVRVDHTIVINFVSLKFADCSRNVSTTDKLAMYTITALTLGYKPAGLTCLFCEHRWV